MLGLLVKAFIRDSENVGDATVRRAYGTLCSVYGIFLNIVLFTGKYFAGILSGSVAVTADAFNNLSDAGASIITLLGFALAGKKPDPDHPYGHGRAEYLSGLVLSAMIIVMGVELARTSFKKILSPSPVETGWLSAAILIFSILIKFYMSLYNKKIGQKISSSAMQATSVDSLSDTVSTLVVLISMGVSALFKVNVDGWVGMAVAIFICFAGYNAAKETISPLLGNAPEKDFVDEIEKIVLETPEIVDIHDLLVHDYGPGRTIISLHAEVDGKGNIYELHDAIDRVEAELQEKMGCLTTIHMDPIDEGNTRLSEYRSEVSQLLKKELDERVSIHDFRMVPGPTHTNLIFDTVLPVDLDISNSEAEKKIKELVKNHWQQHFAVVQIDRSYV